MYQKYRPARYCKSAPRVSHPWIGQGHEFLIRVQSSEPIHTKIPPIILLLWQACCVCTNRHFFRQTGSQAMRELCILSLEGGLVSPKRARITVCSALWPIGRKDFIQVVCLRMRRLDRFLFEAAKNFEGLKKFKIKIKNKYLNIAVDVLSQAYLMVPLSCRSNLAGRYL